MDNMQNEKITNLIDELKEVEQQLNSTVDNRDELVKNTFPLEDAVDDPIVQMQIRDNYEQIIKLHQEKRRLEAKWNDTLMKIVREYQLLRDNNLRYRLKSGAAIKLKAFSRSNGKLIKRIGSRVAKIGKDGIEKLSAKFKGYSLDREILHANQSLYKLKNKHSKVTMYSKEVLERVEAAEAALPTLDNGELDFAGLSESVVREYNEAINARDEMLEQCYNNHLKMVKNRYRKAISQELQKYKVKSGDMKAVELKFGDEDVVLNSPDGLEQVFENFVEPKLREQHERAQKLQSQPTRKLADIVKPKAFSDLKPEKQQLMRQRIEAFEKTKEKKESQVVSDTTVQANVPKQSENKDNEGLANKKQQLLSKYSNLINQKVFGKHWNGNVKHLTQKDIDDEVDNYLTNLIRVGEEKYGDNFVEDIMNEATEEPIKWLMNEVAQGEDLKAEAIVPDYSFMEPQPVEVVPEVNETDSIVPATGTKTTSPKEENLDSKIDKLNEQELERYISNFGMTAEEIQHFTNSVKQYKRDYPGTSDYMAEKAVIKSIAADRKIKGNLTDYQALNMPSEVKKDETVVDLANELPEIEINKDTDYREIAENLTPELEDHYRSMLEKFDPDTFEYQNAMNILNAKSQLQTEADKEAAMDQLHAGERVR